VALVGVATLIPRIFFGILSGTIADRHGRLRLMFFANVMRAVMMVTLAVSLAIYEFQLYLVLAAAFVLGLGQSMFLPSVNAFLPTAVAAEDLGTANGLISAIQQFISIVGSPLGGLFIGLIGMVATIIFNSVAYVVSALFILSVPLLAGSMKAESSAPNPNSKRRSFLEEIREGFAYLKTEAGLLKVTLSDFGANFFLVLFTTYIVIYSDVLLKQGSVVYGILVGSLGAGFGVGSLLVGHLRSERRFGVWYSVTWGIASLLILGLVLFPAVMPAVGFLLVIGVLGGIGNTTFITGAQKFVPNALQGRYFGFEDAGSLAASPAGQVAGGLLIASAGLQAAYTIAAVGAAIFSFGVLLFADVRSLRVD